MSLVKGMTLDGWDYRVYWSEVDGKFRVEFSDAWKEVWVLDDVRVESVLDGYRVVIAGEEFIFPMLRDALNYAVRRISYRLEHEGSVVIRGVEAAKKARPEFSEVIKVPPVLPFGKTRMVFEKAQPLVPRPAAWAREVRHEVPPPPPPVMPKVKVVYGLGAEEMRRLRVLFESTLVGLGIKPSPDLRVRGEEVIYRLESKYKGLRRDEALETAINELLKWIERNVYFS